MKRLLAPMIGILALAVAVVSGGALERIERHRSSSGPLLYLPNGKWLRAASMGQASLIADLVYLWAIQHYSNYENSDRHRYVEHIFGQVITELDPHFVDAYWLGALILIGEAGDLEGGLRLLDAGFEANPDRWVLPYVAAWELYLQGDVGRASGYFDRAASVPDAPPIVRRMKAGVTTRSGDLHEGLRLWRSILDDPSSDAESIAIASRQVAELEISLIVNELESRVEQFRVANGRLPASWIELSQHGYIERVPVDPYGTPFVYDPGSGQVSAPAGRLLGDR